MDTRDWLRRMLQASTTNAANRADMNDLLARAFTGNSDENLQIAQLQLHIQLVRMADDGRRDAQYVIEQLASFGERGDISSGWAPSEGDVVTCTAARVGFSRLKVMIDSVPSTPWPTVRGVLGKTGLVERVDEDSSSVLVRFAHEPWSVVIVLVVPVADGIPELEQLLLDLSLELRAARQVGVQQGVNEQRVLQLCTDGRGQLRC